VAVAVDVASAVPHAMPIQFSASLLIQGWVMTAIGWMFAGASLWAILRSIGIDTASLFGDLPLYTATIALAVVLGFVSMIPAGFGVRDIALLELLVPHIEQILPGQGKLLAFVAVIVLRLVWLAAEVVISAVLFPLGRRPRATS
jgi:glycosyltransferase 2 family protein